MIEDQISKIFNKVMNLDVIFGKWIVLLLVTIYFYESVGFYKLQKATVRITPKVLSNKLKQMEEIGLIGKKILMEHPLRVEYYITTKGQEFIEGIISTFNLDVFLPSKEMKEN